MAVEKKPKNRLTAVDLFSGCGGLTEGLKSAKYKVIAAVEIDELAAKTYQRNHRSTKMFNSDIAQLSPAALMKALNLKAGQLDLLAGCPPCQGFSSLRTRNGAKRNRDSRNVLVHQIVRFAEALRPKAVMLENVPKLASHSSFKSVMSGLKKLGSGSV